MDNHGTLVVENVDLDLLEEQRKALARTYDCATAGRPAESRDLWLLDGLCNLLDAWSDSREENP